MFSIDQLSVTPPLSLFISILLIAGCDLIGAFLLRRLGFFNSENRTWLRWQAPIIGAMLLAIFLFPLALANLTARLFMQVIAGLCILAGTIQTYRTFKKIYYSKITLKECGKFIFALPLSCKLLILILLGMGFLAMGPETSADALDYHLGVAIAILNNGGMPLPPEWFMSRLAGNGEVLNALGLSVGAEQFGSLLQYVSLIGIVGILLFARNAVNKLDVDNCRGVSGLIALAAVSAPVLLFLVSSSKPQMWPIAMTTLAFALAVHPSSYHLSRSNAFIGYSLVCVLVMTASQAKFNHLLGGGVVGMLAFILMVKQRYFWAPLGITILTAALIIGPPMLWKAAAYNSSWFDAIIKSFPGNFPGSQKMDFAIRYLMNGDSGLPFPLSIFIPTSIGWFTAVLGVGGLLFIGLRPGKNLFFWSGICAAAIVVAVNVVLAPQIARMYLEPYFWLLFMLAVQPNLSSLNKYSWLKWPIFAQGLIVMAAAWFGAISLFPGALLPVWRRHVMERYADGYEIMRWADTVLPKNAVLLNGHRSMALSPRDAVSTEWIQYVDIQSPESQVYLDRLKSKKVSHVLIIGRIDSNAPLAKYYGKVLAGPGVGHKATRNPFNQGSKYEAWIVEFESSKLP